MSSTGTLHVRARAGSSSPRGRLRKLPGSHELPTAPLPRESSEAAVRSAACYDGLVLLAGCSLPFQKQTATAGASKRPTGNHCPPSAMLGDSGRSQLRGNRGN